MDTSTLINRKQLRELWPVSDMTIWRLTQATGANPFPTPLKIGNRRYWRKAGVLAWLERQA